MERAHLIQSRIYHLGREYVKLVVSGEITLDDAIAEVRASTKIDYESKMKLVADIMKKWADWCGYLPAPKMSEIITKEETDTNTAFDTIE